MRECRQCGWKGEGTRCPVDGLLTVDPLELTEPDDPNSLIGQVIGDKYLVESRLGKGGMGTVWRARHRLLNHGVALKVIDPAVADPQQASQRFYTEALSCSRLSHPNTIRIFDFGILPQGSFYMVMELLRGHDLQAELNHHGALYPLRAVRIARQVCKSLSEAHAAGVIHRDLKPSNVFLAEVHGEPDLVKVIDFGIAKLFAVESSAALTGTGTYLGTPRYMSPEQASASRVDLRTDLYSLGVVLYEMLVGRLPFDGRTTLEILRKHRYTLPESPKSFRPQVPSALAHLVLSMLAKSPKQRPDSMALVADALDHIERNLERRGMPRDEASPELSSSEQTERYERIAACVIRWAKAAAAVVALAALAYGGYRVISHLTRGPADYLRDAEAAEARDAADALRRYEALVGRYPDAPEAGTARERIRALQEEERRRPGGSAPGLFGASGHTLAIRAQIAAIHCSRAEKAVAAGDIEHARQIYRMVRQVFADTPWGLRADHRLYLLDAMDPGGAKRRPEDAREEPEKENAPAPPSHEPPAPEPPR